MMDADDLGAILETVDALFCSVAEGIAGSTGMEAAHEEIWTLFEGGYFKLVDTDDTVGIVPCHNHDERRLAAEQNKPLSVSAARHRGSQPMGRWRARGEAQRSELVLGPVAF
jgi:hypothetical protein